MSVAIMKPANDNLPLNADLRLPEVFVQVYSKEIFGWAARLQQHGQFLTVQLWNRPNANVLSSDYWPEVTLCCDLMLHEQNRTMTMVVRPDTERDVDLVRKHCEALPAIIAAQKAWAAEEQNKRKGAARWVFDRTVPDYFVHRYQSELRAWAANLKQIGLRKHIVLREGQLSDLSPNEELGAVLIRIELKAEFDRRQGDDIEIVVSASTDRDEMLIRKHCEKLQRIGIPAGMVLVEPERPGIPILPTIKPS